MGGHDVLPLPRGRGAHRGGDGLPKYEAGGFRLAGFRVRTRNLVVGRDLVVGRATPSRTTGRSPCASRRQVSRASPAGHARLPGPRHAPVPPQIVEIVPVVHRQPRRVERQPSAVVSITFGRTTGNVEEMSDWNCISASFTTMPPSTRSVRHLHAGVLFHCRDDVHGLIRGRLQRGAGEEEWPAVA